MDLITNLLHYVSEVKKETQEIYGLINYGVLRKAFKGMKLVNTSEFVSCTHDC